MSDAVVNVLKRLETFTFRDDAGVLVTTAVNGDFTKTVIANGAASSVIATVTQVGTTGRYTPSLTPDAVGDWTVIVEWTADPTFAWSESFQVETAAQADPAAALAAGTVSVTSPVASAGDATVYQGDDQAAADSRSLDWATTSAGQWPDLTGASIVLQGNHRTNGALLLTAAGSVITPTGAAKQVRVELGHAYTEAMRDGIYDSQVIATLASGHVVTLVELAVTVVKRKGEA